MKSFYVMEEDLDSDYKVYLGEVPVNPQERRAMALGDVHFIPDSPLIIGVKYRRNHEMADFLNVKFTLFSDKLKNLLDENIQLSLFYRSVFLEYQTDYEPYYYFTPPRIDCFDMKNSHYEMDEQMPGGIRVKPGGFFVRPERVLNYDIFRVKGLSNRRLLISERLKRVFEENEVRGVKFMETMSYQD